MKNEIDILKDVAFKLSLLNISYMLTGSLAMIYYAKPRMTRDIDLVIEIDRTNIPDFIKLFQNEYYVSKEAVEDSIDSRFLFNLIHLETAVKIDCIIKKDEEYRKIEFSRRKRINFHGYEIFITSKEDLIISKLFWAKDSKSETQIKDIKNLLEKDYDTLYISKWVSSLNLKKFWHEINE